MSANVFMEEAAELAAQVPLNRCPSTDAIEYLDEHPAHRLALEDTWTGPAGRVYREVPAEQVSRWPAHLSRAFRPLLRISRQPKQVFQLLDLLKELDAGPEVVSMTLVGCRKRKSLKPAITYYIKLNAELAEVTRERPANEVTLGTREARCHPRVNDGEVETGSWSVSDARSTEGNDEDRIPPTHRAVLLHDPTCTYYGERDWVGRQPARWKALYHAIRRAKPEGLPRFRERLLGLSSGSWSPSQIAVLWGAYQVRRDYLRRTMQRRAKGRMGPTARALMQRIERVRSSSEAAWVGWNLYRCMNGDTRLPGPVSQPEWSVVFNSYRSRKSAILAATR